MENNKFIEPLIGASLIILLTLLINPLHFYMPSRTTMAILASVTVLVLVYLSFIWQEKPRDEREGVHRLFAGRAAFISGSAVAAIGIVMQTIRHQLDPWLVSVLGIMVLSKMIAFAYQRLKN